MVKLRKESLNNMDNVKSHTPMLPRQGWRAFRNTEEMRVLVQEYFDMEKADENSPPLMSGLAVYLGICHDTLQDYANGKFDDDGLNHFKELLKEAKTYIEYVKTKGALTGKYNANFARFDLGWNHGWAERKDIKVTQEGVAKHEDVTPPRSDMTPEEAMKAYQETVKEAVIGEAVT